MMPLGHEMPVHKVNCVQCAAPLERKTHWRKPRCTPCRRKNADGWEKREMDRRRLEARRYRIILHVLGWENDQFADMLEEMKRSPMQFRKQPESRQAKIDWNHEGLRWSGRPAA